MVSPIFLVVLPVLGAFLLLLVEKWRNVGHGLFFLLVASSAVLSGVGASAVLATGMPVHQFTAGFFPPLSINLVFGIEEAVILTLVNLVFFLSALLLYPEFIKNGVRSMMVYLTLLCGINGIVLTRDLFNLFVFIEITSISLYGLIVLNSSRRTFEAGFKYIIAGGIASIFYLIGTSYLYRYTGNLNIDFISWKEIMPAGLGIVGLFFLFTALLIEVKSFPVNGWALDFYEAAPGALNALISAGAGSALLFVFYKTSSFYPPLFRTAGAYLGLAGFLLSNLMALNQKNERRMLGYSSVGTIGLILFIILAFEKEFVLVGAGLLLVNHILVKSGLFFAVHSERKLPAIIPLLLAAALSGFPPFPGFWAKWQVIRILGQDGAIVPVIIILLGSLFEVVYLFRWAAKKSEGEQSGYEPGLHGNMAVILLSAAVSAGIAAAVYLDIVPSSFIYIFLVPLGFLFIDFLPQKVKGFLALAVTAAAVYILYMQIWSREPVVSLRLIFFILISSGALIHLFASMYRKNTAGDNRAGYYPAFILMVFGLLGILVSRSAIQFLCAWEAMALGSYFLVVKGKRGEGPSLLYIAFSAAGAYLIMAGFAIEPYFPFTGGFSTLAAPLCILSGILMKTGIIGFHVWLPGSYSESDDDASSFLSSTLSKITIFALIVLLAALGTAGMRLFQQSLGYWIGWAGVITAFTATLAAVYQEDIKYLLAYSSIGQLGYIVLAAGIADHAGWTAVMYLSINHFLFKGMLFLAVAGIVYRTGTRLMYQMGGLIKKMPVSFISVLMAIIALSGVPPLSGFGSKWLVYTALLEKGWYLQLALAMFTSTIAFLYLFRLIHAMFLGQPKPEHSAVTEAPFWLIIPQIILIGALMGFSMFPGIVLKPVQAAVSRYFPQSAVWTGSTLNNLYGYWDGTLVMFITMGIFMVFLFWLLFIMRKPVSVEQFNIVFAAERPEKPSTTHYAYNFFSPYRKALGFLSRPYGFAVWRWITGAAESVGGVFRRFYTGNGQTYALHIILFTGILFFVLFGAFYG